jgi:hypothetical protein
MYTYPNPARAGYRVARLLRLLLVALVGVAFSPAAPVLAGAVRENLRAGAGTGGTTRTRQISQQ